jgi:hypothetical protein
MIVHSNVELIAIRMPLRSLVRVFSSNIRLARAGALGRYVYSSGHASSVGALTIYKAGGVGKPSKGSDGYYISC